jgi:hypothetical protein
MLETEEVSDWGSDFDEDEVEDGNGTNQVGVCDSLDFYTSLA